MPGNEAVQVGCGAGLIETQFHWIAGQLLKIGMCCRATYSWPLRFAEGIADLVAGNRPQPRAKRATGSLRLIAAQTAMYGQKDFLYAIGRGMGMESAAQTPVGD